MAMARQARIEYSGAHHHVMSRGNDGMMIFREDDDRELSLMLLGEVVRFRWILDDYALMGNHYRLSITTPECTLSTGMHRLLGRYAQRFNKKFRRRGHLFQDRFKSVLVEDEFYALEVSRYIALNPVQAGLCDRPEDWRWSSYRARVGLAAAPSWLTLGPLMSQLGSTLDEQRKAYLDFVNAKVLVEFDPFEQTVAQLNLGTKPWIDQFRRFSTKRNGAKSLHGDKCTPAGQGCRTCSTRLRRPSIRLSK
jgi:putative transposase